MAGRIFRGSRRMESRSAVIAGGLMWRLKCDMEDPTGLLLGVGPFPIANGC